MSLIPKLNKAQQKQTDAAESSSFKPLTPGRYVGTLQKVEIRQGNAGDYWSWEFSNLVDTSGNKAPGRQWVNTSLSDKAAWKLKEVFEALGYSLDSDTDEMIGEKAVLQITIETATQGKRAGEEVNVVGKLSPFVEDEWELPTEGEGDDF